MNTDRVYIAWMAEEVIQDPRRELVIYPNLEEALKQEAAKFPDDAPFWRWDQDINLWAMYFNTGDAAAQPIIYVSSQIVITSS